MTQFCLRRCANKSQSHLPSLKGEEVCWVWLKQKTAPAGWCGSPGAHADSQEGSKAEKAGGRGREKKLKSRQGSGEAKARVAGAAEAERSQSLGSGHRRRERWVLLLRAPSLGVPDHLWDPRDYLLTPMRRAWGALELPHRCASSPEPPLR